MRSHRTASTVRSIVAGFALAAASALPACSGGSAGPPAVTPTAPASLVPATPAPVSPASPSASPAGFTITGTPVASYANLDAEMQSFMQTYGIRAGQLAVGRGGTVTFSRAYTNTTDPSFAIVQPASIMRVSSNSKALVTAAIAQLYASGALAPSTPVYALLGITTPLLASQTPDPNAGAITVQELVDHRAGFHDDSASAPEFNMLGIEEAAGSSGPLTRAQFARYLYGQPLVYAPGTQTLYSNEDYFLLARVIEKVTGQPYLSYVNASVLAPIGVTDAVVTATAQSGRLPNEVVCDDPNGGESVLTPQTPAIVPDCYGGITVYEVLDGPTSISISAQSLVKYLGHYDAYGLGPRLPGYAREGSFVGSVSWMEALGDGNDFAFTFNDRVDRNGRLFDITPLTSYLEADI